MQTWPAMPPRTSTAISQYWDPPLGQDLEPKSRLEMLMEDLVTMRLEQEAMQLEAAHEERYELELARQNRRAFAHGNSVSV